MSLAIHVRAIVPHLMTVKRRVWREGRLRDDVLVMRAVRQEHREVVAYRVILI